MNGILKFILFVVAIIIISKFMTHSPVQNPVNKSNPSTSINTQTSVSTIPQAYASTSAKISSDIVDYLKKSPKYGAYYNANKKFAIYFTGANCPYAQTFVNAMNSIVNNSAAQQYYNFFPIDVNQGAQRFSSMEEAQKDVNFNNLCHEFCIVNPKSNELFYFDGIGEEEAAKLPTLFADLKNW